MFQKILETLFQGFCPVLTNFVTKETTESVVSKTYLVINQ